MQRNIEGYLRERPGACTGSPFPGTGRGGKICRDAVRFGEIGC